MTPSPTATPQTPVRTPHLISSHHISSHLISSHLQVAELESVLSIDIPRLLAMFPQEGTGSSKAMSDTMSHVETAQPAPALMPPSAPAPAPAPAPALAPPPPPPSAAPALMPPAAAAPGPFTDLPWAVTPADKARYEEIFASLAPQNGLVSGSGSSRVLW